MIKTAYTIRKQKASYFEQRRVSNRRVAEKYSKIAAAIDAATNSQYEASLQLADKLDILWSGATAVHQNSPNDGKPSTIEAFCRLCMKEPTLINSDDNVIINKWVEIKNKSKQNSATHRSNHKNDNTST